MRSVAARALAGAVAGVAATYLMDGVGTLLYEKWMSEAARRREREVEPEFPLTVLARRLLSKINGGASETQVALLSNAFHWGVGAFCGAVYGILEPLAPIERRLLGQPIAATMLTVDEFVFSALGLCPPPSTFPYETHVRGVVAHMAYGLSLAVAYEGIKHLA